MAKEVTFKLNLKVDGKDVVKKLTVDMDELGRAINETKDTADKLRDSLVKYNQGVEMIQNISSSVSQLASTLNGLTEESRSFGGAMASANTMAGKSGEDFANLKDQVSELSKTIPIARDELANGLYQVISNGVPEDNWIEYLDQSARASVGGIADLGETVKVTSTIIKNYGLQWSDAGSIQDKIQLTAKNGVTSFEQLAGALPRVTSQASTLGVSIDELMATFSTLTGVSGDTAEVSTQLAAIFTALIKPSSEAAEMAQQMGIQFDAASIKAAGGMEQFLTSLDKSVKQYAASSGMLEQEVYGKLFGSAESLRAITPLTNQLADKFRENVSAMKDSAGTIDDAFSTMASTGKAKIQILNNKLGEFTDMAQSVFGNVLPYINFTSTILVTISSVAQLSVAMKSLGVTATLLSSITANASKIRLAATAVSRVLQACYTGEAVGATTAAVATRALGVAVKGLLISTGVGIAIVALTEAINYLMNSSSGAASSVDELAAAEQQAKQAHQQEASEIASVRSEMMQNIAKLKDFKGSKEQEKTLVQQMNSKYGEAMGYYSTVSQWYQALTANSKAYCDQMINEIRLRQLANEAADLMQQQRDIKYNEDGSLKKYSKQNETRTVTHVSGSDPNNPQVTTEMIEIKGTSQLDKANAKLTTLHRRTQAVKQEMQQIVASNNKIKYTHTAGYSPTTPTLGGTGSGGGKTGHTPAPTTTHDTTTDKKDNPLQGSIDWYEKAIEDKKKKLTAAANAETAKVLNAQVEGLQRQLYMLKVKIGVESVPPIEVKKNVSKPISEQIKKDIESLKIKPIKVEVKADVKKKNLEKISNLFNIDTSNFESVRNSLESINGLSNSTSKGFATAGAACEALGGAMQQLGANSAAAKAGLVMAALGQLALSFAQAMNSASSNWITWLAFGIAGTAQLISMVSTISQFATGGIVGGNETSGDKVLVRVNSGEMILNAAQQARLFALANGAAVYGASAQVATNFSQGTALSGVTIDAAKLQAIGGDTPDGGKHTVNLRLRGRDLVGAIANETRSNRRRSNIRL